MEQKTVERVVVSETPNTVTKQTVVQSGLSTQDFFVSKTNQIIFTFIGIIDLLLMLRIAFLLLGANRVGFVNFILNLTQIFVAPFVGIFPAPVSGASYFDVAALVAIIVYLVFGAIIGVLLDLFSSKTDPTE